MKIYYFMPFLAHFDGSNSFPSGYGIEAGFDLGTGYGLNIDTDSSNTIVAPLSGLGDAVDNKIGQAVKAKTIQLIPDFPNSGKKSVILESPVQESFPIQYDIKYGNLQNFVAGLLNPKPIVDTIQEHEKYGNDGSKGRRFSTLVVGAFEGLSNALNAAVDVPFQAASQIGRKITTSLNQVGAKLVGLA